MTGFDFLLVLIILGLAAVLAVVLIKRRGGRQVSVHNSIEEMKSIGELHVFKVVTKEIVTAKDHVLGAAGTKYFEWILSSKKMAMIFEFDIAFSYDLKDNRFNISPSSDGSYAFVMPPCRYDLHIKDVEFYDEQRSRLLPAILPELIGNIFSGSFGEQERNALKNEAKTQAEILAKGMVSRLMSDVRASAEVTLSSIARSFGVTRVTFNYGAGEETGDVRDIQISEDALAAQAQ